MYLLGYIPRDNRVYLGDKELNIVSYSLQLAVLEYQTAIMRKDFDTADKVRGEGGGGVGIDRQIEREERMDRQTDRQTGWQTDRLVDRWKNGQIDMGRQTEDGWIDE